MQVYYCCTNLKKTGSSKEEDLSPGFTPPSVQNQYVIQGMGGRCSVDEDALGVVRVVSRDASQPVNLLSVNHRLTSAWFVPLSLVRTWFVPLPVCDHSQARV